jgi:hypothetical protein
MRQYRPGRRAPVKEAPPPPPFIPPKSGDAAKQPVQFWQLERLLKSPEISRDFSASRCIPGDFMWMYAFDIGAIRVQAYKHHATRRYLYVSNDLACWKWLGTGFERLDSTKAVQGALL